MKKITLVGEVETGKTSLLHYFLKDRTFPQDHYPTLGVQAGVKVIKYPEELYGLIQFWDTAGHHDYHKEIAERYYAGTNGFLIVIDKTNENSLKSVNYWMSKIKSLMRGKTYIIGVLATKADAEEPEFRREDYNKMYGREDIAMYEEISLKDNEERDGYTKTQHAIRDFIRLVYDNNLLKVLPEYREEGAEGQNTCNCALM